MGTWTALALALRLQAEDQHESFRSQIEFRVPVVFQTVQLCVVAVAPAQLGGHTAEAVIPDQVGGRQVLQLRLRGDVAHALRQRGFGKAGHDLGYSILQTGNDLAVGFEFRAS